LNPYGSFGLQFRRPLRPGKGKSKGSKGDEAARGAFFFLLLLWNGESFGHFWVNRLVCEKSPKKRNGL
jgi:hypothetical protein